MRADEWSRGRSHRGYTARMTNDRAQRTVTVRRLDEATAWSQPYLVAGTPGQRLALVWPLTVELCSLAPGFDAQSRLSRSSVCVLPPRR